MKKTLFEVESNQPLTKGVYIIKLLGNTSACTKAGQFVNIAIDGFFLRRPISVCDAEEGRLTLVYKLVGGGTEYMSSLRPGHKLDLLTGLGNGYSLEKIGNKPLLIGGGVGAPPLYLLAKQVIAAGKQPQVILGFNNANEIILAKEFEKLNIPVYITTIDGTEGIKGYVSDAMKCCGDFDYCCSCGPESMLKAVYYASKTDGQFSFEERMGCGFGACMGCSCKTKYGSKRICKDGPVLLKEEIIW